MKYIIVIPENIFSESRNFLLQDPNNEQFGYYLAGINKTNDSTQLLVHTFLPARERDDLEYQNSGGICPSPKFQMKIYGMCKKNGYHLIDVHSHPFDSSRSVLFSSIDNKYEFGNGKEGVFGFTASWNPGMYHASIVFGQNSMDARIYKPEEGRVIPISEIKVLRNIIPTSAKKDKIESNVDPRNETINNGSGKIENQKKKDVCQSFEYFNDDLDTLYSRQILAFGKSGQEALSNTSVAVIGAGGLGSIVIESLVRLGIKELRCIDDDFVERSNISRILGSELDDAEKRIPKVIALGRHAEKINPNLKFFPIVDNVINPKVQNSLRDVDFIISGTDTLSSRLALTRFSVQYLKPYIDLGFSIETDNSHKRIISAGGKVISFIPGDRCFHCLGEIDQHELQMELSTKESKKRQISRGYISGVNIPNPSVIFLNMTIASLGICEFLNLLCPFKTRSEYIFYDMLSTKLWNVKSKKNPECPICSPEAEIFGRGDLLTIEDLRENELSYLPENN